MTFWALLVATALADKPMKIKPADCEPLDEASFRALVFDAQAALDRDDAALNAQILTEIDGRLPCLTFAPAPRVWADLLVNKAIAAFAAQGDWQTPLAAAVRVRPQIDRGVGAAHPIGKWEPPEGEAPPSAGPLPEGVVLWVDGVQVHELPPTAGLRLVQRERDGQWITLLRKDEPIPADWLTGEIAFPLTIRIDGQIGGGYELMSSAQLPTWESDYIATGAIGRGGPNLQLRGLARIQKAALIVDGSARFLGFQPLSLAHAHAGIGLRVRPRLFAALGGGLLDYPTFVGWKCMDPERCPPDADRAPSAPEPEITVDWVRTAQVTGLLAWYGKDLDAPVRGGLTFSSRGTAFIMGGWWSKQFEGSWYAGVSGTLYGGRFVQEGFENSTSDFREVTFFGGTAVFELGTRFKTAL